MTDDIQALRQAANARARRALLIFALFLLVLGGIPRALSLVTDWWWFGEIGFQSVFTTSLVWRIALFFLGAVLTFAVIYGSIFPATKGRIESTVFSRQQGGIANIDFSKPLGWLVRTASVVISLLAGASISAAWMTFLRAFHGVAVGVADPLYDRDIGYYLFTLPALSSVLNALIVLLSLALLASSALYAVRQELVLPPRRIAAAPRAARHIGALAAAIFVLVAARLTFVGTADLLHSQTGPLMGASFTDVHVKLPALRVAALAALAGAVYSLIGAFRRQSITPVINSVVLFATISVLGRGLIPFAVERLVVIPNQLTREAPYLERHIEATRRAFGLDNVATRDLSGDAQLSMNDIRANGATIDNVRLWERDLVRQTFSQLQEIRTYYDFVSVTDDRYMIDGQYRQVHFAARELNTSALRTPTFINERLTYTHGMGITMAPVNQVTAEGLPVLFVKDLPPVSTTSVTLTRPQIYYGELTSNYVFVGTQQDEFDYPAGESDVKTRYSGTGGVPVGSFMRRALYAWQFASLKILLSADIAGDARVLYRRNIRERAEAALPFLEFDPEPYLVVSDSGHLKWMLDAYTMSPYYPYSQRMAGGTSYMRNSVKVVIDAYHGSVDAYIAEPSDPIIQVYTSIFGDVFQPLADMPEDLRRHIRYPGTLFRVQASLQALYHMTEAETFYRREDQWQFPTEGGAQELNRYMRHIILRLPGEEEPEFIYMVPFTPSGKDNLAAWMVARMDGDRYGELVVYRFPKQSLVFGPRQVANRISQDTEISRQITLWDQSGSEVIRGELLVIPIEESLIYVQPIFTRAEGGTIPELKRVVVSHGNRVVMGESLEQGLSMLFGGDPGMQPATVVADAPAAGGGQGGTGVPANVADLLRRAQGHYDRAIAAQRAGDWATYGREIEQLGAVLRELGAR